jgi:hypothetical protein
MTNVGMKDRVIRMYAGVIISSVFIYMNSPWALAGIPVFASGAAGFCGLYKLLGINTVPAQA